MQWRYRPSRHPSSQMSGWAECGMHACAAPPQCIPVAVQPPGSAVELERMQQRHEEEVAGLRALLEHRTQLVRRNAGRLRSAGMRLGRAGAAVRASCSR
jgi:hypothetical protein